MNRRRAAGVLVIDEVARACRRYLAVGALDGVDLVAAEGRFLIACGSVQR